MSMVRAIPGSAGRVAGALPLLGLLGAAAARAQPVAPASATGPAVIVGRVVDRAERPLPGATVRFEDAEFETRAAADGSFSLAIDFVPDGTLLFRHVGYAPARTAVRLARGDTVRLVARMARTDLLDTVRTLGAAAPSARLAAFEARRAAGRGVFISRDEIERRRPVSAADVLRWSGAIGIVDSLGALLPTSPRGGKWDQRRNRYDPVCVMRVAIDGMMMPAGFSLREFPAPAEIAGVEIYRGGATLPPELAGSRQDNYCGVIGVWTRSR